MEPITETHGHLGTSSKRFARRLMSIGESRLELLLIEVVEERERFIRSLVLALGLFAFGLLAMMTLTAAVAVSLWSHSPVAVLLSITVLYVIAGTTTGLILRQSMRHSEPFSATLDQLRKDHASLEKAIS